MKQPLISIIVPIYKVELYLKKCLDSIINQTYKNLEIILVDDGSPDNCGKICDEYAINDSRIKVVHKQNGGLSSARNSGLNIATGEYIAFVDSDDYIEKEYVQELLSLIQKDNSKLAMCSVQKVDEKGTILNSKVFEFETQYIKENEKLDLLFSKNGVAVVVAWNKLYHKEIWKTIRYPEGKIHEDEFVIWDVLNSCNGGVSLTKKRLYNYLIRSDSIMGSKKPSKSSLDGICALKHRLSQIPEDSKYYSLAVNNLISYYSFVFSKIKTDSELKKELLKDLKQKYKVYKKYLTSKTKLKTNLLLHCRAILVILGKV